MPKSFYELEEAARVPGVSMGPQDAEQDVGSPDDGRRDDARRRREDETPDEPLLSR